MERIYDGGTFSSVDFFIGTEVEHTPALGLKTLFVVGVQPVETMLKLIIDNQCQHIYLGANQSFAPALEWDDMIKEVLDLGYLVTLDFHVGHVEWVCESGYAEKNNFIPQISVPIPYLSLLGYNATLKIDDIDFDRSNPGVWCHSLHDLQDRRRFTPWRSYGKDTPVS
jgi:hypothetical protein